jgi:protein-S-isoprenylcysteine O-methyltransferase Ste14
MKLLSLRGVLLFFESILFTALVPGTVTVWIPMWLLGPPGRLLSNTWTGTEVAALVPLTLGVLVYLWCLWDFATRGRGIPAPIDHPKQLVVTGLYRYVRNPMYLGVLFILIGEVSYSGSRLLLMYAAAWFLVISAVVLLYEEPALQRKFGSSYERYTAEVGRWVPRWPHLRS